MCSREMPSIAIYRALDVWVPSLAISFIFLSLLTSIGCKVGWKLHRRKRRLVNRWCFEILRLAFRDLRRDQHGRNTIYDEEIGPVSFAVLVVLTVPVIISTCFITFWNIYMVEEHVGKECNSHYDCFPIQNGDISQTEPVQNCTSWPVGTEYKCYRLVYNYVQGVSATGGIMFFASAMLKMYIATLLAPRKLRSVFWKWTCYSAVIAGGASIVILFVLLHSAIPHPQNTVFKNDTYKIQFFLYSFLLFVVFFVTGPLLIYGIECEPTRTFKDEEDTNRLNVNMSV